MCASGGTVRRLTAIVVLLAGAAALHSQSQPPTFRSAVDAVLVDFTVIDRQGNVVRDLKAEDVRVLEDGREQPISTFSLVDLPMDDRRAPTFAIAGGPPAIVDRDVASNMDGEGRLYVIALDDVGVQPQRSEVTRAIARQFVEKNLGPRDRAALVAMSGRYALANEFTADRKRLIAAIDKLQAGWGPYDISDSVLNRASARATFQYLEKLSRWMAGLDGRRKTIIFISEGVSSDIPFGNGSAATDADFDESTSAFDNLSSLSDDALMLRDVIEAAARANVAIYTIDPRGQPGAPWTTIKPGPTLQDDDVFERRRVAAGQVMRVLAAETGGFSMQGSNDFTGTFDRIVRESSSYYVLGYTSDNPKRDGKFRRIRVQAKRPGIRIRARTGYVARNERAESRQQQRLPPGWTATDLAMINTPSQISGVGLRVSAAPFRSAASADASTVAVVVNVRGRDLPSLSSGGGDGGLSVVVAAIDPDGKVREQWRAALAKVLRELPREIVVRDGVRFVADVNLKPGRYALRVAASDGGRMEDPHGSVYADLDVPDFSKGQLAMSGVLLASRSEDRHPGIPTNNTRLPNFGRLPTARRDFVNRDDLTAFARFYPNDRRIANVNVSTSVRSTDGRVVFNARESLQRDDSGRRPEFAYASTIPLRSLAPGDYLLTVSGASDVRQQESLSRQIVFTVTAQ
jgi:VWFA-related protein